MTISTSTRSELNAMSTADDNGNQYARTSCVFMLVSYSRHWKFHAALDGHDAAGRHASEQAADTFAHDKLNSEGT